MQATLLDVVRERLDLTGTKKEEELRSRPVRKVGAARVALGEVGTGPWHSPEAGAALVGQLAPYETFEAAARAALQHAHPLPQNFFKVPLTARVILRALMQAAEQVDEAGNSIQGESAGPFRKTSLIWTPIESPRVRLEIRPTEQEKVRVARYGARSGAFSIVAELSGIRITAFVGIVVGLDEAEASQRASSGTPVSLRMIHLFCQML